MPPESHAERLRQCESLYRKKRMADPETWALGEQAYRNLQRFGSPTWYEWCNQNWGTKWNVYDCRPLREDSDTMVFFTAWSSVPKIVELLSREYPEETITYRWADEDIGHNVGESTLKGGEAMNTGTRTHRRWNSPRSAAMVRKSIRHDPRARTGDLPRQLLVLLGFHGSFLLGIVNSFLPNNRVLL